MRARTSKRIRIATAALLILLPASALAGIEIANTSGSPGATVTVEVKLTGSELVVGTQNDIGFNKDQVSIAAVAANANKPDCQVNPAINKKIDGSETFGFGFLNGTEACDGTSGNCDGVRAIVLATDNVDTIPTGSVLYTCRFTIKAGVAQGTQIALTVPEGSAIGSDASGTRVASFTATGATIEVLGGASGCVGDCTGDCMVGIGELQIGLNIFFGSSPVSACQAFANAQGEVGIGQLQIGLNNFFSACPQPCPAGGR